MDQNENETISQTARRQQYKKKTARPRLPDTPGLGLGLGGRRGLGLWGDGLGTATQRRATSQGRGGTARGPVKNCSPKKNAKKIQNVKIAWGKKKLHAACFLPPCWRPSTALQTLERHKVRLEKILINFSDLEECVGGVFAAVLIGVGGIIPFWDIGASDEILMKDIQCVAYAPGVDPKSRASFFPDPPPAVDDFLNPCAVFGGLDNNKLAPWMLLRWPKLLENV